MSFTKQVLLGLFLGVCCGVFFGDLVAPLHVFASGFVKLMQMTVLPYVVLSIVGSLGSLSARDARRLGLRVGIVILGLWGIAIVFAFLMPLTFPLTESATFFSSTMIESRPPFNFVDLYIPSNPFYSLANNVVPATVLFSVFIGIALIGVKDKQRLLDVLRVGTDAVSRTTRFIVRLTPFGIFAIAAEAAGTLSLEQLGRIQIYLVAYIAIALLLVFWVLPGLVSALIDVPIRDVLGYTRNSLITAFVAGDLFIVLPSVMEACEQILLRHRVGEHDEHKLPEVIVPAAFNFPHAGKLLSLSFILFAGWFADSGLIPGDYPQLAAAGLLTIFGSLNAAIPFLLDLFRIPADMFQLYLATGVLNARFGSLLATMHVISVALLGSAALAGTLRFRPARMLRYGAVTLLLALGTTTGLRVLFATVLHPRFDGAEIVDKMRPVYAHDDAVIINDGGAPDASGPDSVYAAILTRGVLRVGFMQNRMPFAFVNSDGKLVGFEVEAAHLLAHEIGVKAVFVPLETRNFAEAMASGRCDIVMSGIALTPRREGLTTFSHSYLDETLAFVVLDHRRNEFATWDGIRAMRRLRIAAPNVPHYLSLLQHLLPDAEVVPTEQEDLKLNEKAIFDAWVMAAEPGAAMTLLQPRFSVVVPSPGAIKMPVAYPLAKNDRRWQDVVNSWIELKQKDGTFVDLYEHWFLGKSARPRQPRWSILRNVLHWRD